MVDETSIAKRYELVSPILNERQRRLYLAIEAMVAGRGGISAVSRAAKVSRVVIHAGLKELNSTDPSTELNNGRIRRSGGGRKRTVSLDQILREDLEALLEPTVFGVIRNRHCAGQQRVPEP